MSARSHCSTPERISPRAPNEPGSRSGAWYAATFIRSAGNDLISAGIHCRKVNSRKVAKSQDPARPPLDPTCGVRQVSSGKAGCSATEKSRQRTWEPGHAPRVRTPDHHGVRGAHGTPGGCDLVDGGAGSAPRTLRARPPSGGERCGSSSASNEQPPPIASSDASCSLGAGRQSATRRAYERQVWFRRGQRWPVGCEGRISVIKRRHGLRRCRYHGVDRMHR